MQKIDVKELTVKQVKGILDDLGAGESHVIDILFPGIPAGAVSASTGVPLDELESMPMSELDALVSEVKEKNSFFLQILTRLEKVGREAMDTKKTPLNESFAR